MVFSNSQNFTYISQDMYHYSQCMSNYSHGIQGHTRLTSKKMLVQIHAGKIIIMP